MSLALVDTIAALPAGSVMTLVLPLGALIAVLIWFVVLWRRGAGDS